MSNYVYVTFDEREALSEGAKSSPLLAGLLTRLMSNIAQESDPVIQGYFERAYDKVYVSRESLDIDWNPLVSYCEPQNKDSENGAYVMVWVWIDGPESEDQEDELPA